MQGIFYDKRTGPRKNNVFSIFSSLFPSEGGFGFSKGIVFAPNDYISSLLKIKNNFRNGPEYIFSRTFRSGSESRFQPSGKKTASP